MISQDESSLKASFTSHFSEFKCDCLTELAYKSVSDEYRPFLSVHDVVVLGTYQAGKEVSDVAGPVVCPTGADSTYLTMTRLGSNLRKWRIRRKLTIEELSDRACVDPHSIASSELLVVCPLLANTIKFVDILRISKALNVSLNSFCS